MQTLAQKYPQTVTALSRMGATNLARMMGCFARQVDMERALGTNGAVSQWCRGKNAPTHTYEARAADYMAKLEAPDPAPAPAPAPDPAPAPAAPSEAILLVVVKGDPSRVVRVLDFMGCEVAEI